MKKFFIFAIAMLSAIAVKSQTSFFSDVKYDISVGLGTRVSNEPFDEARFGFHLGVDAKKAIKSFSEGKFDTFGMIGLHFVQKGGKQSNDFMEMLETGNSFSVNQLSIPIHGGITYNLKKGSLFLDLGPYLAFGIGGTDMEGFERKAIDFGIGFNLGYNFKKLAFSIGYDKGFTNIATYEVTANNNSTSDLSIGDKYNLKGNAMYMTLRWTLGKK